jgi:hypothetical protein
MQETDEATVTCRLVGAATHSYRFFSRKYFTLRFL